jgi:LacI family transcriptional regulator
MKRVTIYEVAKEADVSLATVSRVINGSSVVKEDTRIRVEEAISKLGYKPNAIAQGLALRRSTTIGLIIPEGSIAYASQVINGLTDVAKIYDYNIILHTITDGISKIEDIIDRVIKSSVDGVLIYCNKSLDESTALLEKYNIPMVVIGERVSSGSVCSVYVDYEGAVEEICNTYLDKGIKDIAVLEDRRNSIITDQMVKGAKKAFENHKLDFKGLINIDNDSRSSYRFLSEYLKKHRHELIVVNRDSQAIAINNAANENGLSIPNDLELICMTDSKYNSMIRPEISSYIMPYYDLGALSMRLITKMLNNDDLEEREKALGYLYQKRNSTKD